MRSSSVVLGVAGYLLRSSPSTTATTLLRPAHQCCLIGLSCQVDDVQSRSYTKKSSVPLMGLGRGKMFSSFDTMIL